MKNGSIATVSADTVRGCIAKDLKSQEQLYKLFYGYAMSICLRYCKSKEDARELVNDSFMKVFTKMETYDPNLPFKHWFKRIVINTVIDHYRANHHRPLTAENYPEVETQEETPIDKLSYEELLRKIQMLPPAYRLTFNLFVMDRLSHEEIASQLGISTGTSKSNLARARELLRRLLQASDPIYFEKHGHK